AVAASDRKVRREFGRALLTSTRAPAKSEGYIRSSVCTAEKISAHLGTGQRLDPGGERFFVRCAVRSWIAGARGTESRRFRLMVAPSLKRGDPGMAGVPEVVDSNPKPPPSSDELLRLLDHGDRDALLAFLDQLSGMEL